MHYFVTADLSAALKQLPILRYEDLTFCNNTDPIKIEIDFEISEAIKAEIKNTNPEIYSKIEKKNFICTYNLEIRYNTETKKIENYQESIYTFKTVVSKTPEGSYNFYDEFKVDSGKGKGSIFSSKIGSNYSILHYPLNEFEEYPISYAIKLFFETGIQTLAINPKEMKSQQYYDSYDGFATNGSNLVWVIKRLQEKTAYYESWQRHVQICLPDVKEIRVETNERGAAWILVDYTNGASVPAWGLSDGTLKLLAITAFVYNKNASEINEPGLILVEEPENEVHPAILEHLLASLKSLYGLNTLVVTHSPFILEMVEPEAILFFSVDKTGATKIAYGKDNNLMEDNNYIIENFRAGLF